MIHILKPKITYIVILILLTCVPSSLSIGRVPETVIKVGIFSQKDRIHVKSTGKIKAVDLNSFNTIKLDSDKDYVVVPAGGSIKIKDKEFSSQVRFVTLKKDKYLRINGRRFRDTVVVVNDKGKLTVINELGLDGYLFGVLPVEVSPKWPIESLKAQAVVSRTYVMNNLGKYKSKGYDLSSDIFSQMYRGMEAEKPATNRAVTETKGMILTYQGSLAKAFFHSSCGGYTENIKSVWGNRVPYLKTVICPYCKDSPRYHWSKHISPDFLKNRLNSRGYNIGEIKNIKFLSRTGSGRVEDMMLIHSGGETKINGHRFRMIISPNIIKSTLMTIDRSKEKFYFYGRGWGHGIGLCQWGAKGQAERGKDFKQILKFYFPGTKIIKWSY